MLLEEAIWISQVLGKLPLRHGQKVLDIGSSTEEFRGLVQPYIDYYVFRPLKKKGLEVVHMDTKEAAGVDITCNLAEAESEALLRGLGSFDVVLCCSLLEHVVDKQLVIRRVKSLTSKGGVLVLTVPHQYPYHEDPIDTMYRPSNEDIEKFFEANEYEIFESAIVKCPEIRCLPPQDILLRGVNFFLKTFGSGKRLYVRSLWQHAVAVLIVKKLI